MPNPEKSFTKVDVPADGSCLFWAVALAYLTPVKNNDALFRQRYGTLFGNEETATRDLDHIKSLVQSYNTYDDTFVDLVRNTFRNRVVDHIRFHEDEFRAFVTGDFNDYLNNMRNPDTWGGEPEIRAMSEMLEADISVSGASNTRYTNGDIQIQLFHVGTSGVRNHYNFGLKRRIVDDNEVGRLQNSLKESIKHYQTKPQDFELTQLLIQEADSLKASTSIQQRKDFEARFQSYIDQIPSYLHSIEKPGFFSHFFLGSFSTLLDTKIAEKLNIKKIYFSFDTSKTLKVAVIKNGQIGSAEDAINNIDLFSISEGKRGHEFTSGELENILKENIASEGLTEQDIENKIEEIKNGIKGTMKSMLVQISKGKEGIFANMEPKGILDSDNSQEFHEIEKGLWNNPEGDIAKLAGSNKQTVKGSLKKILEKIADVHSKYENLLQYSSKAREAAHHGFIVGALNNFRYRYNLRVYLEQFAGRGYADIVLLVRGPDRALDSIPIIIELKAGKGPNLTPDKALEQAKKYAQGFQPNVMRVLTTASDILCVGVNLDYPSPISGIEKVSREGRIIPLFEDILKSTDDWNTQEIGKRKLKEQIKDNLERIYHTFPGTQEKGDNHYFSRFLLGQSLLLNEVKDLRTKFEKYIFIYNKDENIPTEFRPRVEDKDRAAKKKADKKLAESSELDKSHAVVSMVLIPENTEKLVYVINIVEANRKDVLDKVLPLDRLSREIGDRKIVKLNLNFDTRYKLNFERYLTVEASDPVSLEQYNERDEFQGTFREVPYPDQLKETFDKAIDSQLTSAQSSPIDEYSKLFKEVGKEIWPAKALIDKETNFQGVQHGAFSYYSDLKLQEPPETRALVLTEFQTGRGKLIDMLVHGIKFADQDSNAKEYTPMGFELKASRQGKGAEALLKEAENQISTEYKDGVTYKALTDGDKVEFIGVVFNKGAKDADSLILTSEKSIPVKVVHSSTHVLPTVDRLDLSSCLGQSNRKKRSTSKCLFSWDDIDKFNNAKKVDKRNVDKIRINSEKFLTYIKNSQDEGKNAQLVEFIGKKITLDAAGGHKYLLNEVVQDGGYVNYAQNKRIKDLQNDVLQQDSGLAKNLKLKSRLINAAGRIQLIRGIHGAIVSCKDGTATDCGLNLGGIAWSFASQPIENVMVKITPKVVGKVIPGTLGKQTKFAIRVVGVKFGTTVAKGVAGALTGVFDIVDIGMSASNLVDCKNRENGNNPCGEKEIRDNMASISFSGVSFVSGVALTAASMPVTGVVVGAGLMVGYGVYSGISNIIEYEKKYDTTHDENWRIFWHTIAFQPIPVDVQHLAARQSIVNSLAQEAWKALSNSTSNVVAYGIGFGKVSNNAFHPSHAKILMNRTNTDTTTLSRVIPDPIRNAKMICLPQITHADYEKGWKKSVPTAIHYCDNAMVIADKRRESSGKTIVYDLRNIDKGVVVGSNKLNNNFLIFQGATEITGGNNVVNRFAFVNDSSFLGKVIGGSNSTNILDLTQLKDKVIKMDASNVHQSLKVKINDHLLINDSAGDSPFSYHYIGRQNKVDKILCTGYSKPLDVIIDSGGGFDNDVEDVVENCEKVIISPYTTVKGGKSNYTFYVKTAGYKGRDLHSEINVNGTGTIIFSETDLLSDRNEITYSSNNNTLSLKIGLDQGNQYTLNIKNYIEQSSNKSNFILIDKNGSNIVPKIGKSESSTAKIDSFELHTEYSLDNFDAVENHYKKVLNNNKDYKVFGVVRDKVQGQSNSTIPHMMFGSSGDDIINFDQGAMFARSGNGSDTYVIDDIIGNREVKIDNNSDDKKLDTLLMPVVTKDFSIQQCDLYLSYNNTNIQVKNYLKGSNYRHLMVTSNNGETFIPYIQSVSCTSSSVENGKLVPFFHATQIQNMFFLSKDFQYDHVVIDSRSEDIEQYKDKGDLLLMRESKVPFTMKIKGYFDDQSRWKDVNFHLWNNGNFSYFDLPREVNKVMSYQDKLKADYERIVKEYVIDFTRSINITHNQNDDLTSVGQDKEHVGLIILKDITPCRVKVSSSGSDLVLHHKKSNCTINIKNWDSSESHRISTLEFDLGLDPIKIRRLDRFSLSSVAEMQTLIDKVSENYQNKTKCTTKVENDLKCLVSVNGFENGSKTYECLGFSSLQEQINFTEKFCSVEQIEKLKNKTPSSNQVITVFKKLQNDLSLSGYDQSVIDQCNKLMINSELEILKLLISKVAQKGRWNKVKALLDKTANRSNADIEHKNKWSKNWTLLNHVAYNGNVDLVKNIFTLLLKKSGDINALENIDGNHDSWTPLHYAVHYDNLNMVSFFIDQGANIETKSKKGKIPLHLANKEGKLDMVKSLFSRNSDVNAESDDPSEMMELIKSLKEEIISQADTASNVKKWAESLVSSLRDSIKSVVKKELKNSMFDDNYAFELANKVDKFDKKLFGGIIKEVVNDVYGEIDTEEMLKFIRGYNSTTQNIQGYVAVFDKMKKENDLNNNAVSNLAFYVKGVMETSDYSNVNSEERSELERIKKELPESVRNAAFSSKVCIRNVHYNEYLYAAGDYFNYDSDRRSAFTWIPKEKVGQGEWRFEHDSGNYYIKNVHHNEYLYAANYAPYDNDRRRVFTWIPGGKVEKEKDVWKIEDCGSTRKRRDIRKSESKTSLDSNLDKRHHSRFLPVQEVTSSAARPFSWINVFANTIVGAIKGVFQFTSSPFKPAIDMEPSKAITAQGIDTNGTLFLLDVFIRKITGQKYISTTDQPMPLLEARGYALNITTEFERVLKDTAKRSGVSVNKSSFDSLEVYKAIEGKMISGELSKIPTILYSAIEEAYPKNKKFLSTLKGSIEKILDRQQMIDSNNQEQSIANIDNKTPPSSLNSIAVEPANNKSLKGVTFAGRVG